MPPFRRNTRREAPPGRTSRNNRTDPLPPSEKSGFDRQDSPHRSGRVSPRKTIQQPPGGSNPPIRRADCHIGNPLRPFADSVEPDPGRSFRYHRLRFPRWFFSLIRALCGHPMRVSCDFCPEPRQEFSIFHRSNRSRSEILKFLRKGGVRADRRKVSCT